MQCWLQGDETNPELLNQKTRFGPAICQCHISLCLIRGVSFAPWLSSIFIKYERQAHSSGHPAFTLLRHPSSRNMCQLNVSEDCLFPVSSRKSTWENIKVPGQALCYKNTTLLACNISFVNGVLKKRLEGKLLSSSEDPNPWISPCNTAFVCLLLSFVDQGSISQNHCC